MCVILYNDGGKKLDKQHLKIAYDNNPHGYGIMWVEGDRVNITKGICDFDQIWQVLNMFNGITYALHFRWRTAGKITTEQCHPFTVLNKEEHGIDLAMVHNGTIFSMTKHPEKSDTQLFAEMLSNKIVEKDPYFRMNYFHKLEKHIGNHNKMVLMSSDNRTFFINKNSGKYIDDIWYSNTYSLQSGYRKSIIKPKKEITEVKENTDKNIDVPKVYGSTVIRRKYMQTKAAFIY
jgi:predicted glutamine amidotransferase